MSPPSRVHHDPIAAAHPRLHLDHFALDAGRAGPLAPAFLQPGVEHALGRGVEHAGDFQHGVGGDDGHGFFSGFCFRWVSRRSNMPLQNCAVMLQPFLRGFQAFGIQPADQLLAVPGAGDQPGFLQHLEMPGDGGRRDGKGFGQLAHRGLAQRQPGQDGAAGGIGKGGVSGVEVCITSMLINISVKYKPRAKPNCVQVVISA